MMKSNWKAGLAAGMAFLATPIHAQSLPNYGNYQALTDNFRVGVQASFSNPLTGNLQEQASFQQREITDITTYLDPAEIAAYATPINVPALGITINGNQIANNFQISGVFDLRGAPVLAGYAQSSPILTVRFLDESGATLVGKDGQPCQFTYNGVNRTQSFAQFDAATDPDLNPDERLYGCLAQSWTRSSPVDPLVELGPNANSAGDPWQIGAT